MSRVVHVIVVGLLLAVVAVVLLWGYVVRALGGLFTWE